MRCARSQPRSRNSAGNFGPDSVANIAVAVVTRRSGPRTSGVSTGRGRERERDDEQGDEGTNGARHTTSRYWGDVSLHEQRSKVMRAAAVFKGVFAAL